MKKIPPSIGSCTFREELRVWNTWQIPGYPPLTTGMMIYIEFISTWMSREGSDRINGYRISGLVHPNIPHL